MDEGAVFSSGLRTRLVCGLTLFVVGLALLCSVPTQAKPYVWRVTPGQDIDPFVVDSHSEEQPAVYLIRTRLRHRTPEGALYRVRSDGKSRKIVGYKKRLAGTRDLAVLPDGGIVILTDEGIYLVENHGDLDKIADSVYESSSQSDPLQAQSIAVSGSTIIVGYKDRSSQNYARALFWNRGWSFALAKPLPVGDSFPLLAADRAGSSVVVANGAVRDALLLPRGVFPPPGWTQGLPYLDAGSSTMSVLAFDGSRVWREASSYPGRRSLVYGKVPFTGVDRLVTVGNYVSSRQIQAAPGGGFFVQTADDLLFIGPDDDYENQLLELVWTAQRASDIQTARLATYKLKAMSKIVAEIDVNQEFVLPDELPPHFRMRYWRARMALNTLKGSVSRSRYRELTNFSCCDRFGLWCAGLLGS